MLRLINKPISKLSILFVLSILAPGSFLVYFSIQNIVSQKELTEKRLVEEQNEIASDLAQYFHRQLKECTKTFFNRVDNLASHLQKNISFLDSTACVSQVFVVDHEGEFIWPYFLQAAKVRQRYRKSPEFLQSFVEGEKAEFAKANPREAVQLYRKALKLARNKGEYATAINSLARVMAKQSRTKQAHEQYGILADNYGSVIDESGLPFAYYALHQFIQFAAHNQSEPVFKDIEAILSRLLTGQIPLTVHTEFLLQEVSNWFAGQNHKIPHTTRIPEKINSIRKQLSFVLDESSSLKQHLAGRDGSITKPKVADFEVIVGSSVDEPTLLLLNRESNNSNIVGFKVNLAKLKNDVLTYAIKRNTSFDLKITIASTQKTAQMVTDPLTTIKQPSPVVPSWRLLISPKDPKIIDNYISKRRWVYGIALTFLIAGMSFGVVLVLRDVSREQRLAQLRTDFVSNVSHELKTPLTSVRMLAETMRLGRVKNKSEVQEYLSIIVNESERLTRLINTVLDFSKIEQGKKEYELEPTNLSKVVKSVISVMESPIREKGFKLRSDISPNVQAVADADALEQALLNLLSNAIKYTRERKEISVRLWTEDESIYIQVGDQGIGISESEQKRIFEKFYRAHIRHKQDTSGAGLGLTVAKHIVDAHDGMIEVQSKVGEGSTFTIILPRQQMSKGEEG